MSTSGFLSRRSVLLGGGVALALPFLEAMLPRRAQAQAPAAPKRLIVIYTPNGTIPDNFWPTGSGDAFTLSPILQPLAAHQKDLLVIGGVDLLTQAGGPGDPHQRGTGVALTGVKLLEGNFSGDNDAIAGWAGGISIDQHIANAWGDITPFRSLEFGVMVEDSTVRGRISYAGPNKPVPPENSPSKIYERVFEPGLSVAEKGQRRARRLRVIDRVLGQYRDLHKRLGKADRERLESHIESLVELETQFRRPGMEFGGLCQPYDVPNIGSVFDYSLLSEVGTAQLDLLALMMRCDVTRIATFMWTNSQSVASYPIRVRFGDQNFETTGGHHGLAHKGDDEAEFIAKNTAINYFFAEKLAYLIDRLKAMPEGEGTVFDNTLILWTNEQCKGNSHDMGDMPYVLAGSAAGAVRTGQYLRYAPTLADRNGEKGESHNRLLVTVLQAMGLPDTEFGDWSRSSAPGPLPGILV